MTTKTIPELQALDYRQLQAECKANKIPAKGSKDELLGKLTLAVQAKNPDAATPPPLTKTASRSGAAAPAMTPSSTRKSLDKKEMQRAMDTPLPATVPGEAAPSTPGATPAAAIAAAAPPQTSTTTAPPSRTSVILTLMGLLMALSLYSPLLFPYCRRNNCYEMTGDVIVQKWEATCVQAMQMKETALVHYAVVAKKTQRAVFDVSVKAREQINKILSSVSPSRGATTRTSSPAPPPGFDGRLNPAVLSTIMGGANEGGAWEELQNSLADAWTGEKIAADNSKANVILFVCGSSTSCATTVDELTSAAPLASTLPLSSVDFANGKGPLQSKLARFLKAQPRGVVLIPDVDKIATRELSVLSNVMGEYGALTMDGETILSSGATFLLTWQGPPAVLAEDSETSFTLAAKRDLTLLLRGSSGEEAARGVADSFRRRIDLVVPVADADEVFEEEVAAVEEE